MNVNGYACSCAFSPFLCENVFRPCVSRGLYPGVSPCVYATFHHASWAFHSRPRQPCRVSVSSLSAESALSGQHRASQSSDLLHSSLVTLHPGLNSIPFRSGHFLQLVTLGRVLTESEILAVFDGLYHPDIRVIFLHQFPLLFPDSDLSSMNIELDVIEGNAGGNPEQENLVMGSY
jgi:hypothetical protein